MICPLCESNDKKEELIAFDRTYYKCGYCHLVFLDPNLLPSTEFEKKRYLTHENDPDDVNYLKYLEDSLDRALPFIEKVMNALDYGCGPTKGLREVFAKKNSHTLVDSYDPLFFPNGISNNTYDLIFASESVEHFHNPKKEFEKIKTFLKPGGVLAIRTEFIENAKEFRGWYYLKDETHVSLFSKKTLPFLATFYDWKLLESSDRHGIFRG